MPQASDTLPDAINRYLATEELTGTDRYEHQKLGCCRLSHFTDATVACVFIMQSLQVLLRKVPGQAGRDAPGAAVQPAPGE